MRIEISKLSKTKLTNSDRNTIYQLVKRCINTYFLISKENNGILFVLECVPENCVEKIRKLLITKYEINVREDSFMAQIDLMDILSGGLY